jgi:hypothetical protein
MKKILLRTIFLGWVLLAPPLAIAQGTPPGGPDPVLVTKAEAGDAYSQKKLGDYYFARRDNANGLKWMEKSAEGGYADAQNILGSRYETGKGVPPDAASSRKWFRMAAEQGHASAQASLCKSYIKALNAYSDKDEEANEPIGTLNASKADMEDAIKWCGASAQRGLTTSQYNLGLLYAKGSAVIKPNFEAAYFWLSMQQPSDVFRNKVSNNLSAEKKAQIEKSSQQWEPGTTPPTTALPPPAPRKKHSDSFRF